MKELGELKDLRDAEFKAFSQFGDDGIIQYLVHRTGISGAEQQFVEFGVENYEESNTRLLLIHDNWRGLVIDGDPANIQYVRNDRIYWRHDLKAVCAFIDADNIDDLIRASGITGPIGLLSIDIDGNDYWIWQRIDCVDPVIVVVEYNSLFGCEHAVTIPYDPKFRRSVAHFSHLYWGCSLRALEMLAEKLGYALVGSNSAGCNAYFVRRDRLAGVQPRSAREAYFESRYRESRDESGKLSFLSGADRLKAIRSMPVLDVVQGRTVDIGTLYGC
jgi:hypothetical protein